MASTPTVASARQITIKEVINMTPQSQTFMENDIGFRQYCEQYNKASKDPAIQREYHNWINEQIRQEGMLLAAHKEGYKEGIQIGEDKKIKEVIIKMHLAGSSLSFIHNITDIDPEKINKIITKSSLLNHNNTQIPCYELVHEIMKRINDPNLKITIRFNDDAGIEQYSIEIYESSNTEKDSGFWLNSFKTKKSAINYITRHNLESKYNGKCIDECASLNIETT
jgi:hypothetical protein